MDVFFEQIIRKRPSVAQKIVQVLFLIASVVLVLSLFIWAFTWVAYGALGSLISSACVLAGFGVAFLAFWYAKRMYVEYEYSITNGDFDIDRIVAKSKRERVISTSCADFQEFGVYDEKTKERISHREFDSKVIAANVGDDGLYYAVVTHKKAGTVLLVIEPNERILSALKKFLPRTVQSNVFSGN